MGKLTIFDDDGAPVQDPVPGPSPRSPPSTLSRPNGVPSPASQGPSTNGFKRPLALSLPPRTSSPQPKRSKFVDGFGSDDESTVSSSSKRRNAVPNGQTNGIDKGKAKAQASEASKRQRKDRSQALQAARQDLPVYSGKSQIMQAVAANETVIILGETGSGKTTQIPQYLLGGTVLDASQNAYTPRIVVTQPRRVAAISLATRVAEEMGVELGKKCGYSVRFDDRSSPATRLKFVTDGTLLQELLSDNLLTAYDIVVLDEAHERTLRTDMLMGFLKLIQKRRRSLVGKASDFPAAEGSTPRPARPLKVVVMSATLDAERFSEFYDGSKILYIKGRQHPVQILYAKEAQVDYIQAALAAIVQIHKAQPPGDVLVFLAGQDDIEALESLIQPYIEDLPPKLDSILVCPLYARLPPAQQQRAFSITPPKTRKVILATNVAETSITIPGVRYVVDTGVAKLKQFYQAGSVEQLTVEPISKSSAQQRSGRAGREGPGKCFRLYPAAFFEAKLAESTTPEIHRSSFVFTALHLVAGGIDKVFDFPFMDRPEASDVRFSLMQLLQMGAVKTDKDRVSITPLGRQMALLPLEPSLAKTLLESVRLGCTREVVDLLAILEQADKVLINTAATREAATEAHHKFVHRTGDHLMLLNVLRTYDGLSSSNAAGAGADDDGAGDDGRASAAEVRSWCKDNFVGARAMSNVVATRRQLRQRCDQLAIDWTSSCGDDPEPILRSLLGGQSLRAAMRQPDGTLVQLSTRLAVKVHPSSCLHGKPVPAILYHELVHTTATYARVCSRIEPAWLVEQVSPAKPG